MDHVKRLAFVGLIVLACPPGCARTAAGLAREQAVYQAGTNTVGILERYVVPLVPPPYTHAIEAFLALMGGGLAAWNLHQQKALKTLRTDLNGKLPPSDHKAP